MPLLAAAVVGHGHRKVMGLCAFLAAAVPTVSP